MGLSVSIQSTLWVFFPVVLAMLLLVRSRVRQTMELPQPQRYPLRSLQPPPRLTNNSTELHIPTGWRHSELLDDYVTNYVSTVRVKKTKTSCFLVSHYFFIFINLYRLGRDSSLKCPMHLAQRLAQCLQAPILFF